jgi:hypothetical protein
MGLHDAIGAEPCGKEQLADHRSKKCKNNEVIEFERAPERCEQHSAHFRISWKCKIVFHFLLEPSPLYAAFSLYSKTAHVLNRFIPDS